MFCSLALLFDGYGKKWVVDHGHVALELAGPAIMDPSRENGAAEVGKLALCLPLAQCLQLAPDLQIALHLKLALYPVLARGLKCLVLLIRGLPLPASTWTLHVIKLCPQHRASAVGSRAALWLT